VIGGNLKIIGHHVNLINLIQKASKLMWSQLYFLTETHTRMLANADVARRHSSVPRSRDFCRFT